MRLRAPRVAAFDVTDKSEEQAAPEEEPLPETEPAPVAASQPPVPAAIVMGQGLPMPPAPMTAPPQVVDKMALPPAPQAPPSPKKRVSGGEQGADSWHARVLGRLNAVKTFPASARARRQQGTVVVRFAVDRKGKVLSVALDTTSGFALLDREALALPRRTSPLPPPPEDVPGDRIELTAAVEFYF